MALVCKKLIAVALRTLLVSFLLDLTSCSPLTIEIISLGNINMYSMSSFPVSAPAYDIGLAELQQNYSGVLNFSLTYLYNKGLRSCEDVTSETDNMMSEYYYRKRMKTNVTVILLPGCTESTAVARLGSGWKQLVLISSYNELAFRNKALYPNVIQAGPLMARPIMAGTSGAVASIGSIALADRLRATKGTTTYYSAVDTSKGDNFDSIFEDIRRVARVVSFWGHAAVLRRFLIEAARRNMANGDYVYLYVSPYEYPTSLYGNPTWKYHDDDDEEARKAFRSLLMVIPTPEGEEATRFRNALAVKLKRMSKESYNYTYPADDVPTPIVTAGYASMYILGKVLNESFANISITNYAESTFLAQRFWNAEFDTPLGRFSFDEVGERRIHLDVQQFSETSGLFSAVFRLDPYTFKLLPLKPLRWWTGGGMPLDVPVCGFQGTTGPCALSAEAEKQALMNVIVGVVVGVVVFLTLGALLTRHFFAESQLASTPWLLRGVSVPASERVSSQEEAYLCPPRSSSVYQEAHVSISVLPCITAPETKPSRNFLVLARELLSVLHPNIAKFHGVVRTPENLGFAFEYCQRGDLHRFLHQPPITLDRGIKHGLILDLLQGLKVLHDLPSIRFHGLLNCSNCVIDNHFTLKLTDTGVQRMSKTGFACKGSAASFEHMPLASAFHLSPEQINVKDVGTATCASDVFSVGTLCAEIITEGAAHKLVGSDLIEGYETHLQELVPQNKPAELVRRCWNKIPPERPSLKDLISCFQTKKSQLTVVQKVINRLSKYAGDLEHAVGVRTQALLLERQKCDQILSHMLPVSVVEKLRKSIAVEPETFDLVTMQFSDIVGFVDFVQSCVPLEVVDFLNKAHGLFDTVISEYDVYKVETISDSYFIASGLPRRNEDRHIVEVCHTAIRMQKLFQLADFTNEAMSLRIGIHSGPCVAAVVGLQRPRYCLFGDTVNTTSRMETHGEPYKIHLSGVAGDLIKGHKDFNCSSRGEVEIKGKGKMSTYWLLWKTE